MRDASSGEVAARRWSRSDVTLGRITLFQRLTTPLNRREHIAEARVELPDGFFQMLLQRKKDIARIIVRAQTDGVGVFFRARNDDLGGCFRLGHRSPAPATPRYARSRTDRSSSPSGFAPRSAGARPRPARSRSSATPAGRRRPQPASPRSARFRSSGLLRRARSRSFGSPLRARLPVARFASARASIRSRSASRCVSSSAFRASACASSRMRSVFSVIFPARRTSSGSDARILETSMKNSSSSSLTKPINFGLLSSTSISNWSRILIVSMALTLLCHSAGLLRLAAVCHLPFCRESAFSAAAVFVLWVYFNPTFALIFPRVAGGTSAETSPPSRATSLTIDDDRYRYSALVIMKSVSMSGANCRFASAIWNSYSKSETARKPLDQHPRSLLPREVHQHPLERHTS